MSGVVLPNSRQNPEPPFRPSRRAIGTSTWGDRTPPRVLPTSSQAAKRLGWTTTKFNRKLDNVCDKLSKLGVRGLQGDLGALASNRRARLVEYALAVRLVTRHDLELLVEASNEPR